MTIAQTVPKQQRVALLLNWRSNGYARPHYGLVDDEELLRTGKSIFLSADGQRLPATRNDLLLLEQGPSEVAAVPILDSRAASRQSDEEHCSGLKIVIQALMRLPGGKWL